MLFEPTNIEVLIRLINLKERNVGGTELITNIVKIPFEFYHLYNSLATSLGNPTAIYIKPINSSSSYVGCSLERQSDK
jgi:hypothetical protein